MKYNNNILTLRKISINDLISVLTVLREEGADYVDITGVVDDVRDVMNINVKDEYMRKEKELDNLSDEYLNRLI